MPLPLIIGGAIASLVLGKIISNAVESDDKKTCNPGPFDVLFNQLTSPKPSEDATEAGTTTQAVTTTSDKKEVIKTGKSASTDPVASSLALASMLESQRVQSQALVGLSGVAGAPMVCEASGTNAYPAAVAAPGGTKAQVSGTMGLLNLDADTRMASTVVTPPTPASAAKKLAQYKTNDGASNPPVAKSQSIVTSG